MSRPCEAGRRTMTRRSTSDNLSAGGHNMTLVRRGPTSPARKGGVARKQRADLKLRELTSPHPLLVSIEESARLLGVSRAFEWMTQNRKLSAAEAREWGLVSEVVPDDALAAQLAGLQIPTCLRAGPDGGVGDRGAALQEGISDVNALLKVGRLVGSRRRTLGRAPQLGHPRQVAVGHRLHEGVHRRFRCRFGLNLRSR